MPITPEERARIARENGAKSKGPVTPEGKDRSRLNSFKTGEHAQTLAHLVPTDEVVSTLEDRREYAILLNSLILQYRPVNDLALGVGHQFGNAGEVEASEEAAAIRRVLNDLPQTNHFRPCLAAAIHPAAFCIQAQEASPGT